MSFFEKARQAADKAAEQARVAAEKAGEQARIAATQAGVQAKVATERVRRSMTHERLAELIVKATALQERTNEELRLKNSPYRIQEITVTASIPPNIGFTIGRLADPELVGKVVESVEILEGMGETTTLDIEHPDEAAAGGVPVGSAEGSSA
jgi:hypothetical protein